MFWLLLLFICVLALNWQIALLLVLFVIVINSPLWLILLIAVGLAIAILKEFDK